MQNKELAATLRKAADAHLSNIPLHFLLIAAAEKLEEPVFKGFHDDGNYVVRVKMMMATSFSSNIVREYQQRWEQIGGESLLDYVGRVSEIDYATGCIFPFLLGEPVYE